MIDYTPAHNALAEQSVLAAMIGNNELIGECFLKADDFFLVKNKSVFNGIQADFEKNGSVDAVTLKNHEDIDLSYVIEIVKNSHGSSNFITHQRQIKEAATLRSTVAACYDIVEMVASKPESALKAYTDAQERLAEVGNSIQFETADYSAKAALKDTFLGMKRMVDEGRELVGISTGYKDLDKRLNGLKPSTLVVLAARPAMGKTTKAMNIAERHALDGGYPLVFSIEMPREQLMQRMIASNGSVNLNNILNPSQLDDYGWACVNKAMSTLTDTNMDIIDKANMTIERMRYETRQYVKRHGKVTLIVVDYLQLIQGDPRASRFEQITYVSMGLKALAKEFNVPVLCLSQLNRGLESRSNKRPINSDLRESGQIEQDADEIIFIYRDEVYDENTPDKGLAEIIVGKCRMGQIGTCYTHFTGHYCRFDETDQVPAQREVKKGRFEV